MVDPSITRLASEAETLVRDFRALNERVNYLHVAVMRGDPRFSKAEHAKPDFDCDAFDAGWHRKGKRVPSLDEVFG